MRRAVLLACIILACATTSLAGDELAKLVRTIALEHVQGRIDHMSVSADGRYLFVAALGNNSVEVVDTERGVVAGAINEIKEPQGVAYIPATKALAVASGGDDEVRLYDESLKPAGSVKGLPDADNVRYDPQARLLYVGYGSGALAVIDPVKATCVAHIKLDGHPESFQLESKGNRIFVNIPTAREIAVVDRDKHEVIAKWAVKEAASNFPMALDESGHRLFVGCRKPSKLLVYDVENGKTVATLDCCGDVDDIFYDVALKRIYLTGGEGCIGIFEQVDVDHYRSLGNVKTAPGARTSLFVPETGMLHVAVPHRGSQPAEIRTYDVRASKK